MSKDTASPSAGSGKSLEHSGSIDVLRRLLDRAGEVLWRLDGQGRVTFVNGAVADTLGYEVADVVGRMLAEILVGESKAWARGGLGRWLEGRSQGTGLAKTLRFRRKDASEWVGATCWYGEYDGAGTLTGAQGVMRAAEGSLAQGASIPEEERLLSEVLSSITDGISVLDTEYRILRVNATMERWYAHKMPLVGKKCYEAYHGQDVLCKQCPAQRTLTHQEIAQAVVPRIGAGGQLQGWLDLHSFPLRDSKTGAVKGAIEYMRDITEQKETQDRLEKEEQLLRTLVGSLPDCVYVKDREHRFVMANEATALVMGAASTEALLGKTDGDFYEAAQAVQYREEEEEVMSRGWPLLNKEQDTVDSQGRLRYLLTTKVALRDSREEVVGLVGVSRDVTDRRRAEENLRESEERFRQLAENIGEIFWLYDVASRRFLYVSPGYESVFGRSVKELYDRAETWTEAVHDEDAERVHFHFAQEREGIPFESQYRIVRPDGGVRWVKDRGFAVTDEQGKVYRLAGIAEDITERKQARQALEISEEKYRGLYEGSRDGIAFTGMDGRIQEANQAFLDMLGYTLEEIQGLTFWDLTPVRWHEQQKRVVAQALERGYADEYEKEYFRKDGSIFPVRLRLWLVRDNDGRPLRLWAIVRDVTEQKQAQEDRERLTEALEAKNMELESLIHATSHDLRSPLVNVEGFSRHLEKYCARLQGALAGQVLEAQAQADVGSLLEQDIPEALYYVRASVRKMDALINGLLQLSRVGGAALRLEPLDMNVLIGEIRAAMEYQLEEGQVTLEVASLPECWGDREQISRVFTNLLDNALKYREASRESRVRLSGRRTGQTVLYCMADNGVGIPEGRRETVFKLFHREHSGESEGEGVGLTIAKKIVERHGGRIWAESEAGQGSRFFVELPGEKHKARALRD